MGPDDLVLCSGTLRRGIPFAERVAAASGAGFAAISMWGRDYAAARAEGWTDADMCTMLDAHGLVVAEIDPAWWWLPGASEVHVPLELDDQDVFRFGEDELFAMADALGARSLNAVDVFGGPWDLDGAAEAFARLCRRAAEHDLLVHIEWLPWSKIPDLDTALEIVQSAGQANGGLNIDAWHFARSGTELEQLRQVDGALILGIQLDDGPVEAEPDLIEATLHRRVLPGEGGFDLGGLVQALTVTGTKAPVGVEVFSDRLHQRPAAEAALAAARATRQVMERAG
jgi:sugar phosphate isomerase/epimerase